MKRSVICVISVILVLFTVAAFAADWTFVSKTTDGCSWYLDKDSIRLLALGMEYGTHFTVKIVPGGNAKKSFAQKYGKPVGYILENWAAYPGDEYPLYLRKVYDTNGRLMRKYGNNKLPLIEYTYQDLSKNCVLYKVDEIAAKIAKERHLKVQ